jgi:membrane-bound acyltransferase YfiQ involved in biofilm formation
LSDLLLGKAFGIYYFIPVLAVLSAACQPLKSLPSLVPALTAASVLLSCLSELQIVRPGAYFGFPWLFWAARNPLRWWGYFMVGWFCSTRRFVIADMPHPIRRVAGFAFLGTAAVSFAVYYLGLPVGFTPEKSVLVTLSAYCVSLGILFAAYGTPAPAFVRFLSEASFPIYLHHYFFVSLFRPFLRRPTLSQSLSAYLAGVAGSIALLLCSRKVLGRDRARRWLG